MDATEVLALVTLNATIDSILGLVIALIVVARVVRKQWTRWLKSKEADPYLDRVADRVLAKLPSMPKVPTTDDFMEAIEPRIAGLEERISQPLDLNLGPIVQEVTTNVTAEIEKIRAQIDGHMGFLKKVGKQTGEAVVEEIGNEALQQAGVDPNSGQAVLARRLSGLLADEKWVREHPAAAIGLEVLQAEMRSGVALQTGGSSTYTGGLTRRRR